MTPSIYHQWRQRLTSLKVFLVNKFWWAKTENESAVGTASVVTQNSYKTIGRYQICAELGQRGSTMVYRGHDPKLGREVAIRALLPSFSVTDDFHERFQREIKVIAAMEHPSIVQVFDFGETDDHPFVVMPYLAGGTLERRLPEKIYSLGEMVPILKRIAGALDQAHRQGIIHGQINPGNILFDDEDQAYLSDFGITQFTEATSGEGSQNAIQIQLDYISPEQAAALKAGDEIISDEKSDIYALGVTIFEALTGQLPYQSGNRYEAALARLTEPPPQLRSIKPNLPSTYQALIDRALATNPEDRYTTATHLAQHAEEIVSGRWYFEPITEPLPPIPASNVVTPSSEHSLSSQTEEAALSEKSIGRYHIQEELGRGAMGVVYRAYDPQTNRQVAIKVLPCVFSFAPEFRQSFQREAELVAKFNHEAVVRIYDFGEHDDQPYIVMQYLPGGTLSDRMDQNALNLRQTAKIIERIAAAVDEAHRRNIIHQDVKSANIMFNAAGEAFLSDFGIATILEQTPHSDDTPPQVGGTPMYMSPEQAEASLNKTTYQPDPRSDIYSLGVIFFEALTGQLPYPNPTSYATMLAHITQPIPRLSEINSALAPECQTIIDRVLAKNPADRYPSAGAFAHDVVELASGRMLLRRLTDDLVSL
ncbi:MAG: serine/threonine protein kinase [Anaerolineae bacterium]|nr:serine/threonine protein kinase [Anaerolineae bacterium]